MTSKTDSSSLFRKVGLQPLAVLLFIEILFSRLSDNATLVDQMKQWFHISWDNMKFIFALLLIIPLIICLLFDIRKAFKTLIMVYVTIDTVRLFFAITILVSSISTYTGEEGGDTLFKDVLFIWFINTIVFGVWYWLLDAGGPYKRNSELREKRDFLFPQMSNQIEGWQDWKPDFLDYLFLAFVTSTTFGPTDTMVLSRRVKGLMILQVVASLAMISVIAARAVTILK